MGRWLMVAALGAAFVVMPAFAQRHGGGGFGGYASMGGFHGSAAMSFHGPGYAPGGGHWAGGYRGYGYGRGYGWGYRGYYPYARYRRYYPGYWGYGYGYPWWGWNDGSYDSGPSYSGSTYYPVQNYPNDSGQASTQQAEIDRLNDEVARLREAQSRATTRPEESTELVYRDKHTEEVKNYAIVGQTLWILNESRSKKVSLADLDIPATRKANEDRGVDFSLPN